MTEGVSPRGDPSDGSAGYQDGAYMGHWAGNVETIPAQSPHLPDFFYSGPTPSVPVRTGGEV